MTMTREQQEQKLAEKLDACRIEHRKGTNGKTFSYLEAWELIETANAIFGFFGWSRETIAIEPLHDPALITDGNNPERGKVVAAYYAKVRISVYVEGRTIVREELIRWTMASAACSAFMAFPFFVLEFNGGEHRRARSCEAAAASVWRR
jgi:hypothetical protein